MAIDGKWQLNIETPIGAQTPIVELRQDGDSISGTLSGADGSLAPIENPTVSGNAVTWTNKVDKPVPATLEFRAEIQDDRSLTGNVKLGPFGNAPMTGTLL